ncbi:hypothetical protein OAU72_00065 [Hyphomicrobiales bacterium]|nr:hypothetical protein [Hyphomicrobiales bacterium]
MGLNSDIVQVIEQIDKIINEKPDRWLNISDYTIDNKDRNNMKSVYGLIHNILHYSDNGQKIIHRTHKDNIEYLYKKCLDHMEKKS